VPFPEPDGGKDTERASGATGIGSAAAGCSERMKPVVFDEFSANPRGRAALAELTDYQTK
jgi:hypothetical protein